MGRISRLCGWFPPTMQFQCLLHNREGRKGGEGYKCGLRDAPEIIGKEKKFFFPFNPIFVFEPAKVQTKEAKIRTFFYFFFPFRRWYFGRIKRLEAERRLLLSQNDSGAFLVRDSESGRNDYSLSVRDGATDSVKHYRIRFSDDAGGFYIARRCAFRSLQELVDHYGRSADGLCVCLRKPCWQVSEHP